MNCNDPLLSALKDVGYNVVRLPRSDVAPLQILSRSRSNLDPVGSLPKLIVGVDPPPLIRDEAVTTVKGQRTRTTAIEAGLGLGFLGAIIKGMGGSSPGLDARYRGAGTVTFDFPEVARDSVSIDDLDRFLSRGKVDPDSRFLSRLIESDGLYVLTATLKGRKIRVEAQRSDGSTLGVDVPAIQGALGGKIKVGPESASSSAIVYEGDAPLVFGFQAVRIRFRGGEYHGLEVIDAGGLSMRDLEGTGPSLGEAPPGEGDPRLVVVESRRSPFVRIGVGGEDAEAPGETAPAAGGPGRKALVIGINTYANLRPPSNKLSGCVNDAQAMAKSLTEQFGFATEDVEILTEERATRDNILAALDRLVERVEPGDLVVVHYSGHGSQVPDLEKDEPDGMDETIVPHDSGRSDPETGDGPPNRDITDDEIYERLRKLAAKTDAITLVFDCCHSGTITRDSFGEVARYLEPDLRENSGRPQPSVSPETIAELTRAMNSPGSRDVGPTGFLPLGPSYVLIAGCSDKERSFEYRTRTAGSVPHGALTFFLLQEMARAQPGETYRDVFERAAARVTATYSNQHPQIEGDADRELFGTRRFAPMRHVLVAAVRPRVITLAAGAAQGVTAGSVYAVHPQGAKQVGPDTPRLGTFRVQMVRGLDSDAVPVGVSDITRVLPNSRAVEIEHALPPMSEVVAVEDLSGDPARAPVVSTLRDALAGLDLLRPAGEGREPTLKVYALPAGGPEARQGAAPGLGRLAVPSWATVGLDGQPLTRPIPLDENNALDTLLDNLGKVAQFRNVLAVRNPDPNNPLSGKVELILLRRNDDLSWSEALDGAVFREGDLIGLRIVNKLDRPVYATVLDFGLSHAITPMFPIGDSQPEVAKGFTFDFGVDPAQGVDFPLGFPEGFSRPEGKETFKMIVTTKPADFRVLRQEGARAVKEAGTNPLEQLLVQATGGTRDTAPRVTAVDQWVTVERSFTLVRGL